MLIFFALPNLVNLKNIVITASIIPCVHLLLINTAIDDVIHNTVITLHQIRECGLCMLPEQETTMKLNVTHTCFG